MSHMYYGLKVCNKQSMCHFGTQNNKQFNSLNGVDYSKPDSEEVRQLKRELSEIKKENEFLKKVSAY
ncbi:hypothetical protein [Neptunomonas phycophila]|uniref:hypothetical protein n=1 Tax=Neptunomonas phycophila TaxID=1572645 RepID=UPI0011153853|nr:hypothetical protein [Neptunomonas phycophila]